MKFTIFLLIVFTISCILFGFNMGISFERAKSQPFHKSETIARYYEFGGKKYSASDPLGFKEDPNYLRHVPLSD